jgi:hypothetical protein
MVIILTAFTLFHLAAGLGSLGLGMRLLAEEERKLWDSKTALVVAEVLCWVYPVLAFICASWAWRLHAESDAFTVPLMLAPIGWLLFMGVVFAVVDFAEDGVIGNVRRRG